MFLECSNSIKNTIFLIFEWQFFPEFNKHIKYVAKFNVHKGKINVALVANNYKLGKNTMQLIAIKNMNQLTVVF